MNHVEEQRYAQGLPFMAAALSLMDFSDLFKSAKEVTSSTILKQPVDMVVLQSVRMCGLHCDSPVTSDQAAGRLKLQELV